MGGASPRPAFRGRGERRRSRDRSWADELRRHGGARAGSSALVEPEVQLAEDFGGDLAEATVVGQEAVDFPLDVGGLGVDGRGEAEVATHRDQGLDLLGQRGGVGRLVVVGLVAPVPLRRVPQVLGDRPADAAVLADDDGAVGLVHRRQGDLLVGVEVVHVAHILVEPARRGVDPAAGVDAPDPAVERGGLVLAPALVVDHPHDDARVVVEPPDHPPQLELVLLAAGGQPDRLAGVLALVPQRPVEARGHVLPDEDSQAVAMVVIPVGLDLDVLAEHVEAGLLEPAQLPRHGLVGGGRQQAVGPPALVERPVLEDRLAVEPEVGLLDLRAGADRHPAHREIRADRVGRRAGHLGPGVGRPLRLAERRQLRPLLGPLARAPGVLDRHQLDRQVVEERVLGRPELGLGDLEPSLAVDADDRRRDRLPLHQGRAAHRERVVLDRRVHQGGDPEPAGLDVGGEPQLAQRHVRRHGLHPDGLPDPRDRRVPDAARVELLLAPRLLAGVRRVGDRQDQLIRGIAPGARSVAQERRDVEGERVGSPGVRPDQAAVDPERALVVDRPEVEQDALAVPVPRHGEGAAIPEPVVGAERPADPRQRRLERERDEDLARELRRLRLGAPGDGVVPQAVQVLPALPHELRPRILPPGVVRRDLLSPFGHEAWPGRLPVFLRRRDADRDQGQRGDQGRCLAAESQHGSLFSMSKRRETSAGISRMSVDLAVHDLARAF